MKSKKLRGVVVRAILVSTLICAINMNIIANKGTFSMFTSSLEQTATIKTAETGNLIKELKIVEEEGQKFIVIEPGELLNDNSIVYFEVTGAAAAYIMHIDPVALLKDKTPMNSNSMQWDSESISLSISKNKQYFISNEGKFYIPIYVNINIWQKISFSENDFEGKIILRYLNGFINEARPISLSSSYLNRRWACGTDYYFWEKAKDTLYNSNTLDVNKLQDVFNNSFQKESTKLFNETLNSEQVEIIDSIANGYIEYVSNLETKNKELLKQLEVLQREKEKSIDQINVLLNKNVESSKELQSQIETLKLENQLLESTINELKKTIDSNTKATINPTKDNGTGDELTVAHAASSGAEKKVTDSAVTNDTGNEKNEE